MFLYKNNKLQQIRGFCGVVEYGSFTKASKYLKLTKTTIQAQVVSLERDLGCKLYKINNKKEFALTPDGERFFTKAKQVLEALEGLFEDKKKLVQNRIRMAGHSVFMARFFPEIQNKLPNYKFDIKTSINKNIALKQLELNELDVVVYPMLEKDVNIIQTSNNVIVHKLFKYDIYLGARADHVIFTKDILKFKLEDFKQYMPQNFGLYISGSYYSSLYTNQFDLITDDLILTCVIIEDGKHVNITSKWLMERVVSNKLDIKYINAEYLCGGEIYYYMFSKKNNNIANIISSLFI